MLKDYEGRIIAKLSDEKCKLNSELIEANGGEYYENTCMTCGKLMVFTEKHFWNRLCSQKCKDAREAEGKEHRERMAEMEEQRHQWELKCKRRAAIEYRRAQGQGDHDQECKHCGQSFHSSRSDAKYCSAKCRVYANRLAKSQESKAEQ